VREPVLKKAKEQVNKLKIDLCLVKKPVLKKEKEQVNK
jgi:hypothetical protein